MRSASSLVVLLGGQAGKQPMKLSHAAMVRALQDFRDLKYPTEFASLYQSFLVGCLLRRTSSERATIKRVNDLISELFLLYPTQYHEVSIQNGRLEPFHYSWLLSKDSGRKTVWNITTRGAKQATTIFNPGEQGDGDIRSGMRSDAAQVARSILDNPRSLDAPSAADALPRPKWQSLACLVLRDTDFLTDSDWNTARQRLIERLGITSEELDLVSDHGADFPPWSEQHRTNGPGKGCRMNLPLPNSHLLALLRLPLALRHRK